MSKSSFHPSRQIVRFCKKSLANSAIRYFSAKLQSKPLRSSKQSQPHSSLQRSCYRSFLPQFKAKENKRAATQMLEELCFTVHSQLRLIHSFTIDEFMVTWSAGIGAEGVKCGTQSAYRTLKHGAYWWKEVEDFLGHYSVERLQRAIEYCQGSKKIHLITNACFACPTPAFVFSYYSDNAPSAFTHPAPFSDAPKLPFLAAQLPLIKLGIGHFN